LLDEEDEESSELPPSSPTPRPDLVPGTHIFSSPHVEAEPVPVTTPSPISASSSSSSAFSFSSPSSVSSASIASPTAFSPRIVDCSPDWGYREGRPLPRVLTACEHAKTTTLSYRGHQTSRMCIELLCISARRYEIWCSFDFQTCPRITHSLTFVIS
jgi:hypothetical protein